MMKSKANLFLIGAAKSGTTALAATLGQHPAIAPLPIKEPGHFSTDLRTPVFSSRYNRLLQWDEADLKNHPSKNVILGLWKAN